MTTSVHLVSGPAQQRSLGGIGASEAAAAIGASAYQTPLDAWLVSTGRVQGFQGNEKTEWGHTLEPVIRAKYVEKNGVTVYVPPSSIWHQTLPWLKATPDGIVLDAAGRWLFVGPQVKNIGLRMAPAWADGVPTDYLIQGVVEMAVTDLPRIDFAVLIGGQEYREFTLDRDIELEAVTLEGLAAFWALVESDTRPAIDASSKLKGYLVGQLKKRVTVPAAAPDLTRIERWKEIVVQQAQLKREEKVLKNELLAAMVALDAARMTSDLGPISIGNPRKKTAWKEVAQQLRPLATTVALLERELAALRAEVADDDELAHRIEGLRAQVRLAGDLTSFDGLVASNTKVGEASVGRPRAWTKDIGDDDSDDE